MPRPKGSPSSAGSMSSSAEKRMTPRCSRACRGRRGGGSRGPSRRAFRRRHPGRRRRRARRCPRPPGPRPPRSRPGPRPGRPRRRRSGDGRAEALASAGHDHPPPGQPVHDRAPGRRNGARTWGAPVRSAGRSRDAGQKRGSHGFLLGLCIPADTPPGRPNPRTEEFRRFAVGECRTRLPRWSHDDGGTRSRCCGWRPSGSAPGHSRSRSSAARRPPGAGLPGRGHLGRPADGGAAPEGRRGGPGRRRDRPLVADARHPPRARRRRPALDARAARSPGAGRAGRGGGSSSGSPGPTRNGPGRSS